jgi:hypothetical protein
VRLNAPTGTITGGYAFFAMENAGTEMLADEIGI